jgi:nucleotide-binding universal stress UspA family protein
MLEDFMNTAPSLLKEPHLKTTRVRFANILVAVDLSASSATTLKMAADLAYQHGSRLVIAHVLEPAKAFSETAAEVEAKINLWMRPYLKNNARCSIAVAEGEVVHEISSLVKKHCTDLLIIGTHAATNVERLVMGSKAEALFRNTSIPVLTIGPHVQTAGSGFSSILLPTDLQPGSFRAAQYAVSLAEEANATLTVLHVLGKAAGEEERGSASLRLQQLVPEDAALWCKPVFRAESGNLTETILSTAEQTRAGLIVLAVTHARLLADHAHWSVASKVVRWAECPVLTVRDHL